MNIQLTPSDIIKSNCLILVGGSGDPIEKFQPLADAMAAYLSNYSICTFTFSQVSQGITLLDKQTSELLEVLEHITSEHSFQRIDIWCTSMGAYATIKTIMDQKYANIAKTIIFFDPADYYLDHEIFDVEGDLTWSGGKEFAPTSPTISETLKTISSSSTIHVVHLTLRNYSAQGYLDKEYQDRGRDHLNGYPRLNTMMVKSFYENTPSKNRGEYIEVSGIPHGFIRDGDISKNLLGISQITAKLLALDLDAV